MRATIAAVLCLFACACATGAPWERVDDPPLRVGISVTGLKADERALLKDQVCALANVADCAIDEKKGRAELAFSYRGSLGRLRHQISRLPHPGLKPVSAAAVLVYEGFDNRAPTIVVAAPKDGEVVADQTAVVQVEVRDPDTAAVTIAGAPAERREGGRYSATVALVEGDNFVVVKATDEAGNEAEQRVRIVVDTTPPELTVEVQVLSFEQAVVKGKAVGHARVTVDGKEAQTDLFGGFSVEVRVDPDKRSVEVVATDAHGNARTIRRSLAKPSPSSGEST